MFKCLKGVREVMAEYGILEHERQAVHALLADLAYEQSEVAEIRREAMTQSSETWHDNAPADAAMHESGRIAESAKNLQKLLEKVTEPYPDEASTTIQLGSFAIVSIWGTTVGTAIVGVPQAYKEEDFEAVAQDLDETIITSPEAPLGAALWGLTQDTTGQYSLEGGRSFDFTVLGVDQEVIRRLFAETPVTTD